MARREDVIVAMAVLDTMVVENLRHFIFIVDLRDTLETDLRTHDPDETL